MARIAGVDLPRDKRVEVALTYIYGVGHPTAKRIIEQTALSGDTRVRDLSDSEVARLRQFIDGDLKVEGALRTEIAMNVKRLMDIGSYRGIRHRRGLPRHVVGCALPRQDAAQCDLRPGCGLTTRNAVIALCAWRARTGRGADQAGGVRWSTDVDGLDLCL